MRSEFERFQAEIERALEYGGGTHTLDDVWSGIEAGDLQLWPGANSVIVTTIVQQPQRRDLHFFLAAGTQEELKRTYPIVLAWGMEIGCEMATFTGRKGWERTFLTQQDGWKPKLVTFERELNNGRR